MKTKLIEADEFPDMKQSAYDYMRAIQLNAAKWGMEQAARIVENYYARPDITVQLEYAAEKLELPK